MKKQLILSLALTIGLFSFAQKKELKAAEKALKNNNFSEAKAALGQVEGMLSSLDEKNKTKYYLLKGKAFYANGNGTNSDVDTAIENLDLAESSYAVEVAQLKQAMSNSFLTKGNEAYQSKDYASASNSFEKAYRITKKDTIFLYYAASTAVSVQDYDNAIKYYEELKDLGFTGIEQQYFAINKESGEEEILDKNTRDLYVKAKSHISPGERVTKSKSAEIIKNIALIYVSNGDNEKAISAMKEARESNPDDVNLLLTEANVHYKMGNKEEFARLLKMATEKDPENAELQYNLGVIANESGDKETAKQYYNKAIELDPSYINAYINTAALILSGEEAMIEEMNGLGSSAADDKRYDALRANRQQLYKDAVPYLQKALEVDSKSINAAKTLMNIYSVLGETDKFQEIKAKVEALESEN